MAYLQVKLDKLTNNLKVLKNASAILFIIVDSGERDQPVYESLKKVEDKVNDLNDKLLLNCYNKIFRVFLVGDPNPQIIPDDYFAFIQRLGTLLEEATLQANEANIALREAIGPESIIGKWEGRDYRS